MKELAPIFGMIIVFVGNWLFNKWEERRKDKKNEAYKKQLPSILDRNAVIKEQINSIIVKLQHYTQANRVCLFDYTNGTYTHAQIPVEYIETTHEATDEITKPIINDFKKVPISPYLKMILKISNAPSGWHKLSIEDTEEEIVRMLKNHRSMCSYNFRVSDVVWDGVVSLTWLNVNKELSDEMIDEIRTCVSQIKSLSNKMSKKQNC